jgi:rubrerythrin
MSRESSGYIRLQGCLRCEECGYMLTRQDVETGTCPACGFEFNGEEVDEEGIVFDDNDGI